MTTKALSRGLLGAGLALMIFAVFKDVSHDGYYNLHKASQQSIQLMLGGFLFLAGVVATVANRSKGSGENAAQEPALPPSIRSSSNAHIKPEFAGEMVISSPPYQLFLTRQFSIEKNATLEKYVIGDDVFDTLEDSLREADRRYQVKLSDIEAENEKARRDAYALEQRLALESIERNKREAADREEQQKLFKTIATYLAYGAVLLGTLFLISEVFVFIQAKKFMAEMEAKYHKRGEILGQVISSGRLFGYKFGDESMDQLAAQLKAATRSGNGIQCLRTDCRLLPDFHLFEHRVDSVQFEYCTSTGNDKLTKVVLWYSYIQQANEDFELLNGRNRQDSGLNIKIDSLSLSISRPDVCQ